MANFQLLNVNDHKHSKINIDPRYPHSQGSHVIPLSVFELVQAQADYPIVLLKDEKTGAFHLVALLGLAPKQNLFIQKKTWAGEYIPQHLRCYPLTLTKLDENSDQQVVLIDEDSTLVNETEGERLFDDNGQQSAWLQQQMDFLANMQAQKAATEQFIEHLVTYELISPQSLTVTTKQGEERHLTGLYLVDENKLKQLSESTLVQLHQQHMLAPVYACLFAQQRISRLINLT